MNINQTDCNTTPLTEQIALIQMRGLKHGQFHTVIYRKNISLSAKFAGYELVKISLVSGRVGVDYDALAETIEARQNGAPKGELKGFKTIEPDFLYQSEKDGSLSVRFTTYKNGQHASRWFLNGVEKTLEELLEIFPKSYLVNERKDGREAIPMNLKLANILAIN